MSVTVLKLTSNDATATLQDRLSADNTSPRRMANQLIDYLGGCAGGSYAMSLDVQIAGGAAAPASGTLTGSSVVATDTCAINGVTFTCVASGAGNNQFNVGLTDTATMANLAAAINASTTAAVNTIVTATSALAVTTVTATHNGALGNAVTLVGNSDITASAARLAGGLEATANVYHFGL